MPKEKSPPIQISDELKHPINTDFKPKCDQNDRFK